VTKSQQHNGLGVCGFNYKRAEQQQQTRWAAANALSSSSKRAKQQQQTR